VERHKNPRKSGSGGVTIGGAFPKKMGDSVGEGVPEDIGVERNLDKEKGRLEAGRTRKRSAGEGVGALPKKGGRVKGREEALLKSGRQAPQALETIKQRRLYKINLERGGGGGGGKSRPSTIPNREGASN